LFEEGSGWTDQNLFNGEYYEQKVNATAHEVWPETYRKLALRHGKDDKFEDWPQWQFGRGCLSDQLIGQWYASMLGLGYLYNPANVWKALGSVFRYNWKPNLWNHPGFLRIYAVNDEPGLVICTWPMGERPGYGFYFADEIWCGIEYQVASHMLYEGMIKEGLAVVMGTRNRHRGDRRNPWDEFECGHHYARSMASYALLLALSGYRCCVSENRLGFAPRICEEDFRSFFSTATGWGLYTQRIEGGNAEFTIALRYGSLLLERLDLPTADIKKPMLDVNLDGEKVKAKIRREKDKSVVLLVPTVVRHGQILRISLRRK